MALIVSQMLLLLMLHGLRLTDTNDTCRGGHDSTHHRLMESSAGLRINLANVLSGVAHAVDRQIVIYRLCEEHSSLRTGIEVREWTDVGFHLRAKVTLAVCQCWQTGMETMSWQTRSLGMKRNTIEENEFI